MFRDLGKMFNDNFWEECRLFKYKFFLRIK